MQAELRVILETRTQAEAQILSMRTAHLHEVHRVLGAPCAEVVQKTCMQGLLFLILESRDFAPLRKPPQNDSRIYCLLRGEIRIFNLSQKDKRLRIHKARIL